MSECRALISRISLSLPATSAVSCRFPKGGAQGGGRPLRRRGSICFLSCCVSRTRQNFLACDVAIVVFSALTCVVEWWFPSFHPYIFHSHFSCCGSGFPHRKRSDRETEEVCNKMSRGSGLSGEVKSRVIHSCFLFQKRSRGSTIAVVVKLRRCMCIAALVHTSSVCSAFWRRPALYMCPAWLLLPRHSLCPARLLLARLSRKREVPRATISICLSDKDCKGVMLLCDSIQRCSSSAATIQTYITNRTV